MTDMRSRLNRVAKMPRNAVLKVRRKLSPPPRPTQEGLAERYVFVVTYGRSGSTVLMKLINAMGDFDIKGENNGAAQFMIEACRRLDIARERHIQGAPSGTEHPWYGFDKIDEAGFAQRVRNMIEEDLLKCRPGAVSGYKEIRYLQLKDDEFAYHIDFLLGFPDARIVFNTRDAQQVANSGWWRERPKGQAEAVVERLDRLFAEQHAKHPDRTWLHDHSEVGNYDRMSGLAQFLGGNLDRETHARVVEKPINRTRR